MFTHGPISVWERMGHIAAAAAAALPGLLLLEDFPLKPDPMLVQRFPLDAWASDDEPRVFRFLTVWAREHCYGSIRIEVGRTPWSPDVWVSAIRSSPNARACPGLPRYHLHANARADWGPPVPYGRLDQDGRVKPMARGPEQGVSQKLRWAILERDGFRCQAGGAVPSDDDIVCLEVDHWTPSML